MQAAALVAHEASLVVTDFFFFFFSLSFSREISAQEASSVHGICIYLTRINYKQGRTTVTQASSNNTQSRRQQRGRQEQRRQEQQRQEQQWQERRSFSSSSRQQQRATAATAAVKLLSELLFARHSWQRSSPCVGYASLAPIE